MEPRKQSHECQTDQELSYQQQHQSAVFNPTASFPHLQQQLDLAADAGNNNNTFVSPDNYHQQLKACEFVSEIKTEPGQTKEVFGMESCQPLQNIAQQPSQLICPGGMLCKDIFFKTCKPQNLYHRRLFCAKTIPLRANEMRD